MVKKGCKHSEESKRKMSENSKGYKSHRRGITWKMEYGVKQTIEMRRKTKESWKEKYKNGYVNPFFGKNHSEGTKRKMSERIISEENRKKMSIAQKGKINSEETRRKISIATLGKPKSEEMRKRLSNNAKTNPNFGMRGKIHSEESMRKMKENNSHFWAGKSRSKEFKQKLRNATIKRIKKFGHCIGCNEKQNIREFELSNKLKLIPQYVVCGYKVDGYNKKLNIAIEIDEKKHERKQEKDFIRQQNIINEIGCTFIRVKDY